MNDETERNLRNDANSQNSVNSPQPPFPSAADWLADLRAYRTRLDPGQDARQRQGADRSRSGSPAWDMTGLRIRRVDKVWYDRWIVLIATGERTPPHWDGFRLLRRAAEDSLPAHLRELLRDPGS